MRHSALCGTGGHSRGNWGRVRPMQLGCHPIIPAGEVWPAATSEKGWVSHVAIQTDCGAGAPAQWQSWAYTPPRTLRPKTVHQVPFPGRSQSTQPQRKWPRHPRRCNGYSYVPSECFHHDCRHPAQVIQQQAGEKQGTQSLRAQNLVHGHLGRVTGAPTDTLGQGDLPLPPAFNPSGSHDHGPASGQIPVPLLLGTELQHTRRRTLVPEDLTKHNDVEVAPLAPTPQEALWLSEARRQWTRLGRSSRRAPGQAR